MQKWLVNQGVRSDQNFNKRQLWDLIKPSKTYGQKQYTTDELLREHAVYDVFKTPPYHCHIILLKLWNGGGIRKGDIWIWQENYCEFIAWTFDRLCGTRNQNHFDSVKNDFEYSDFGNAD